ncbi:hypothetical protein C2R22_19550 [Salinigranum rubrum]|uniref:DUF8097 domain-containing protein n=1 Tax=Salinigranum rubrum TaxID=755307 RepID=A0A2I8VNS0_9EURY|nr:hypothetical protein [Salinigranum rubrum]AUV83566.1 hypothetical protein C2R22_19550 [Salinigranum rubrum]
MIQTVYIYLYDRDWCAIRTNRRRGALLVACWLWIDHTRLPHGRAVWLNRSLGSSLARMVCRLWYGVLRPLPGIGE